MSLFVLGGSGSESVLGYGVVADLNTLEKADIPMASIDADSFNILVTVN